MRSIYHASVMVGCVDRRLWGVMRDLDSHWEVTCCHQSFPAQAALPEVRMAGGRGSSRAEEGAGGWVGLCEGCL